MPTPSPCAIDDPHLGRTLLARYRIDRQIGEGGFGRVYQAKDLETGTFVALKIGRGSAHGPRMEREARLAALLENRHSVRVLGFERLPEGSPVIVMELLRGVSLRQHLLHCGRVRSEVAIEWSLQLAEALREAHDIGLVHRDVKPSNLFLQTSADGRTQIKLLDFGLARTQKSAGEFTLTGSELVLGSPAYMSPEQIRSGEVSARSDIWSFGIVLYEMLAGHRPFRAESNAGLLAAIAADEPEPLPKAELDHHGLLAAIIDRCLRKRASERYGQLSELIEALRQIDDPSVVALSLSTQPLDETISAPRPRSKGQPTWSLWRVGLATAVAVVVLLGLTHFARSRTPLGEPLNLTAAGLADASLDPDDPPSESRSRVALTETPALASIRPALSSTPKAPTEKVGDASSSVPPDPTTLADRPPPEPPLRSDHPARAPLRIGGGRLDARSETTARTERDAAPALLSRTRTPVPPRLRAETNHAPPPSPEDSSKATRKPVFFAEPDF